MIGVIAFWLLAIIAVVAAVVTIRHPRPVMQALALVVNLLAVAGLYILLDAQFFAAIQVIVYAGAIVVLITFVIMLLNLEKEWRGGGGGGMLLLAVGLGIALLALLWKSGASFHSQPSEGAVGAAPGPYGSVAAIGAALFGPYFFPFEVISLALVAAMTGAVLLSKRNLED